MMESLPPEMWLQYQDELLEDHTEPYLPADLEHHKFIEPVRYIPSEPVLRSVRRWLKDRGVEEIYYFLTESVEGERTDFLVPRGQLTRKNLKQVNPGRENVMTSSGFEWAIFIDHQQKLSVGGPRELFKLIEDALDEPLRQP